MALWEDCLANVGQGAAGYPDSWGGWVLDTLDPHDPALAKNRCVLVPDMPSFGGSDDFVMEDAAKDILEALLEGLQEFVDITHGIDVASFSFGTVYGAVTN